LTRYRAVRKPVRPQVIQIGAERFERNGTRSCWTSKRLKLLEIPAIRV
jgi:hypothetical protein